MQQTLASSSECPQAAFFFSAKKKRVLLFRDDECNSQSRAAGLKRANHEGGVDRNEWGQKRMRAHAELVL